MAKQVKETVKVTRLEMIKSAIEQCKDRNGRITPKAVVQAAANPKSVLHAEFEWDMEKAAHQAWEARARELIRSVKFIVHYEDKVVAAPYYVSDPSADESSYVQTAKIAKSKSASTRVLSAEVDRIKSLVTRARSLAIAFGLEPSFEHMLDEIVNVENALEAAE
jgi:hypothetical protein